MIISNQASDFSALDYELTYLIRINQKEIKKNKIEISDTTSLKL